MTARVRHIIKRFDFEERQRAKITLGPGTRLDGDLGLALVSASGVYSTAFDLFVVAWSTTPRALKRWTGFMADVSNPLDNLGAPITDVRYRLKTSTQELYWNNGANDWVAAAPNNWNTEAEIADHISTFPVADQTLQVVINLRTTDDLYTPRVTALRVLMETDLEEMEDYVWRSLLPDMESKIRPIGEHDLESDGTATIDLESDYRIETPYDIVSVDSVYNLTSDPLSLVDLFSSYDAPTKALAISPAPALGDRIRVRFVYRLPVAVNTSQDYIEVAKVPQIIFENVDGMRFSEALKNEYIINKSTGVGKQVDMSQSDIELTGIAIADKSKDLARIAVEIRKWADKGVLIAVGQDEEFRLGLLGEFELRGFPTQQEKRTCRFRIRIANAVFFDSDATDITGVLNFGLDLTRATR